MRLPSQSAQRSQPAGILESLTYAFSRQRLGRRPLDCSMRQLVVIRATVAREAAVHFGLYLKKKGIISAEQLVEALEAQLNALVPIGQLALEEGILSARDIFEVLRAQSESPHVLFGELAIELRLMTRDAVDAAVDDPDRSQAATIRDSHSAGRDHRATGGNGNGRLPPRSIAATEARHEDAAGAGQAAARDSVHAAARPSRSESARASSIQPFEGVGQPLGEIVTCLASAAIRG